MKGHAAYQHYVIKLKERAVKVNANAAAGLPDVHQLHQIACVVVERFYSLRDEGSKDLLLFRIGDHAVDAGRKDDRHLVRGGPVCDQTSNKQVYDLPGAGPACSVRHNKQDSFPGLYDVFQAIRIYRSIEPFSYLDVSK